MNEETDNRAPDSTPDPTPFYRQHVFFCVNKREDGHVRGCCDDTGSLELPEYMKAPAKEVWLQRLRLNSSG